MEQERAKSPGRPRSQEAWGKVIGTTRELLRAEGYGSLTMEGIAKAAGVGKPTLYRWWPNVPSIVMEALKRQAEDEIGVPDTGALAADLLDYLGRTCRTLSEDAGDVMRCLMAEAQFDAGFALSFREAFIASRRNALIGIFRRGITRGELAEHSDLELLADLCYGPIWYRLLNRHAALDESFVTSLAACVLAAAAGR